jgi:CDP-glycerol glycerophosphotransferase (TagB/SpsB family)
MNETDMSKKRQVMFVLQKTSKDYDRMKAVGPVLDYGSLRHKMKFFEATKIISAAANDLEVKLLGHSQAYYRNLCKFDFVYLRHGVAKDDQSRWLNKLQKNIRIILSTSTREHDAIIAGYYGYTEREVKLTGLPRFDNLYDERQKKITILPTWRKNIEGERRKGTAKRGYIVDFKDTDYFKFYNALINDERLLDTMRKNGFTGTFYLHPVLEEQLGNFKSNDVIEVGSTVADYQTLFRESSIMVTDFSSVAFDFAYLKKPLVYSQFDEATFYQDHSWDRGYFTYREDGFGPITNTVEETVDALIHYIENGCQMEDIYVKRVEDFFPYTDRNNCERVFEAVLEAEQGL